MTTKQIKTEIQQVLNDVPESILEEVLNYLKSLKGKSMESVSKSKNVKRILKEDSELLRKLAE